MTQAIKSMNIFNIRNKSMKNLFKLLIKKLINSKNNLKKFQILKMSSNLLMKESFF